MVVCMRKELRLDEAPFWIQLLSLGLTFKTELTLVRQSNILKEPRPL